MTKATWTVKDFNGRGARTAHLVMPGRKAICGTHMGYGNLRYVDEAELRGSRPCGSCVRIAKAQEK